MNLFPSVESVNLTAQEQSFLDRTSVLVDRCDGCELKSVQRHPGSKELRVFVDGPGGDYCIAHIFIDADDAARVAIIGFGDWEALSSTDFARTLCNVAQGKKA